MIDVYQQASHLVNESGMNFPGAIATQLDRALGPEGYYGAFGTHYDYSDNFDQQLLQAAIARNVPLVSAQQMLEWTDARNASSFNQISWNGNSLQFTASVAANAGTMMRGTLPMNSTKGRLQTITKSGTPVSFTTETIKGVEYAMFTTTSGSYAAIYASDTTAPTVTNTSPGQGANNVSPSAPITATLSEAIDPSTLSNATFQLKNSNNVAIPATVSYEANTKTARLTPSSNLSANTTFTATLSGGSNGVKDLFGNALSSNFVWTFTTAASTPSSLWTTASPPAGTTLDNAPNELGTVFQSSASGTISGIRFYKPANDASSHAVTLWNSAGTPIATATTNNETATGWQTASFSSPVSITANTTYTASYFTPTGSYAYTYDYFTSPYTNGVLQAPASAGVYKSGSAGFPNSSYRNSNYWVDVIFNQ